MTTSENINLPASGDMWEEINRKLAKMREYGKNINSTDRYKQSPKDAVIEFVAPFIDKIQINPTKVLIATFKRLPMTAGGVYLPDSNLKEDEYQGCAGLIIKKGSLAFKDDGAFVWDGYSPEVGDWVAYRPMNGVAIDLLGLHCRTMQDIHVTMTIPYPTLVW
jgi:co-chaperonin GroES (HSP10)